MQNKGPIKLLAILFALVSIYQLSFTYCTRRAENKAVEYAQSPLITEEAQKLSNGDAVLAKLIEDSLKADRERFYIDSITQNKHTVMNILLKKFTYKECKERELNLGLDLKGGMNVTLEVSTDGVIRALSGFNNDPKFNDAVELALKKQKSSQKDFVDLFYESLKEIAPNDKLASYFLTNDLRDKINYNSTDEEVLRVIKKEAGDAFDRTFQILRNRIDRFGVAQPNIQKLQTTERILIELPGIKDPTRVRKLLQSTAQLEFWETYEFAEIYSYLELANERLASLLSAEKENTETDIDIVEETNQVEEAEQIEVVEQEKEKTELDELLGTKGTETSEQTFEDFKKKNPLFAILDIHSALVQDEAGNLYPNPGPVVGYASGYDTAKINNYIEKSKNVFPSDLRLFWSFKPIDSKIGGNTFQLVAIKVTSKDKTAPLGGDVVLDAFQDFDQFGNSEVTMIMNSEGTKIWKRLTADNIDHSIAIVLDKQVYSFPTVRSEIPTGRSSISGGFTMEEATDLATVLKSGKLPAPVKIVEEAIVGPSLGKEAITSSLWSFVVALILVLVYMLFFYNKAGIAANIALFINALFLFGVLASLQAVLTLPGIAGIILTFGMAVDANVIIYERIKEELENGKGVRLAIADGYKNSYSAIIDGNISTILTGIILYVFGSGPVQGFATTLIIGIITSMFTSIFVTRLFFTWMLNKNYNITFYTKITRNFLKNTKIDFISKRKISYFISGTILLIGITFLFTKGVNYGVDFAGGRSYIVRFDQDVRTVDIMNALEDEMGVSSEVKTFGPNNQVKIVTKFMIEEEGEVSDSIVERKVYEGIKSFYKTSLAYDEFVSDDDQKVIGRLSSQKVGPTVARDMTRDAILAMVFSLIVMFAYIAVRFKNWQYGLGATLTQFHDALIAISAFSIFYTIMPFNLEVDQTFIAAILTIIGYSINDTVVIFDRIREFTSLFPKRPIKQNMNEAMNSTLSRTVNTLGSTLVVLLAIFIFGSEVIRGFAFALIIGVAVGTYSSIFVASPLAYDFLKKTDKTSKTSNISLENKGKKLNK